MSLTISKWPPKVRESGSIRAVQLIDTVALALACVDRDYLFKYVDAKMKYKLFISNSPVPTDPSDAPSVLDLLTSIRGDARFDGLFPNPGDWNLPILFMSKEDVVLDYFNQYRFARMAVPWIPVIC